MADTLTIPANANLCDIISLLRGECFSLCDASGGASNTCTSYRPKGTIEENAQAGGSLAPIPQASSGYIDIPNTTVVFTPACNEVVTVNVSIVFYNLAWARIAFGDAINGFLNFNGTLIASTVNAMPASAADISAGLRYDIGNIAMSNEFKLFLTAGTTYTFKLQITKSFSPFVTGDRGAVAGRILITRFGV